MTSYVEVLSKYAVFTGRAARREYWGFIGWNVVIGFGVGLLAAFAQADPATVGALMNIYQLAVIVPSIAVAVRRMHDTGHSGWWALFPFVNLVLALSEGDRGPNKYGPDPKAERGLAGAAAPQAGVAS